MLVLTTELSANVSRMKKTLNAVVLDPVVSNHLAGPRSIIVMREILAMNQEAGAEVESVMFHLVVGHTKADRLLAQELTNQIAFMAVINS